MWPVTKMHNSNDIVSPYGTLRFRGNMSRRFGHSPSCLTCAPWPAAWPLFPTGSRGSSLPVLLSSSSLSFWGVRVERSPEVSAVRVRRVSINFALLHYKPVSKRSVRV